MYRQLRKKDILVYCPMWPCDRECGKFHERFLNTTKLRRLRTFSESIDNNNKPKVNEKIVKETGIVVRSNVFEEIMERAAKKNSQNYIDVPLPSLPEELKTAVVGRKRKPIRQKTQDADTTMIYFDNPVWDDAKFRRELLDSDEENYLKGDPPSILDEEEDGLDNILKTTKLEISTNPTQHYQLDESILSSDDDYDYSTLDLTQKTNDIQDSPKFEYPKFNVDQAGYEKSLTDL